jgi:hypothetical protein
MLYYCVHVLNICYVVGNGLPFQSLSSYVTSIHVEPPEETGEDRTVLYDVPSSNVIELRGSPFSVTLSYTDINFLLEDNLDLCHEEGVSVLKWILLGYKKYCDRHPLRFKNDILGYMGYLFHVSNRDTYKRTLGTHIQRIRDPKQRKQGNDDVLMLRNLVAMEVPSIEVM